MILGHGWLQEHNPEVNWETGEVLMSRCPARCSTCRTSAKQERAALKAEVRRAAEARTGPFPKLPVEEVDDDDNVDDESEDEFGDQGPDDDHDPSDSLEDGDRVFVTSLAPEADFVQATTTVSQRLAEAHAKASAKSTLDGLPEHFYDFQERVRKRFL